MNKSTFVFDERDMSDIGDVVLNSSLDVKWSRLNDNINAIVYLDDIPIVALERTLDLYHKEGIIRYSRETGCKKVLVYEGDMDDEHLAVQTILKGLYIVRVRSTQEFIRILESVRDSIQ
jgi:hypothetical protein